MFFNLFNITKQKARQAGYTLVELSISTTIIAMMAVGGLTIMGKKDEADKVRITEERLNKIELALQGFIRSNRYVPCPATPSLLESNTLFGTSVSYNTTTKICDGASLANGTGAVPVRTLNLSDEYSYDGWNRKFTFRTSDYAGAAADFDTRTFHGDISITDRKGIQKTNINELPPNNNGAIYVVISYGSNGKNVAYRKNDATAPSQATGVEKNNTDHTLKSYVQAPKSETFDDIVIYGMKKTVILPKKVVSPIKFDPLACENARAIVASGRSDLNTYAALGATELANANQLFLDAQKLAYLCDNDRDGVNSPDGIGGLTFWIDASDASTVFTAAACTGSAGNGNLVMCWKDKSTNPLNATNANANGTRPTYITSAQNGKNIIRFDGGDSLVTVSVASTVFFSASEITAFLASKLTNPAAVGHPAAWESTVNTNRFAFLQSTNFNGWDFPTSSNRLTGTTNVANTFNISAYLKTSTNQYVYTNGALDASVANTSTLAAGNSIMTIGARATNLNSWTGDMGEMFIYNRALSTNERVSLENYLGDKWGITVSGQSAICAPGQSFLKTTDHPEGACQCTSDNQLYQKLADPSACSYGNGVIFNGCVTPVTSSSPTYSSPPTTTGMTLWLDSNDCSTISLSPGTAKVTQWNDKSPTGLSFTQSTDNRRPLYTLAAVNSKPAITFDGSNDFLVTPSILSSNLFSVQNNTAFLVMRSTNSGNDQSILTWSNTDRFNIGKNSSNQVYFDFGASGTRLNATISPTNRWTILTDIKTATDLYIYQNGLLDATRTQVRLLDTTQSGTIAVGSWNTSGYPFTGDIAEALIYNRTLSTTERNNIESYLGVKYAIMIDPVTTPLAVANTLQLWLDASDINYVFTASACTGTPTDGSTVGCWADKSPTPYNAVQATGASQPLYKAGILKGNAAIMFDGTDDKMVAAVPFSTSGQTSTTVFMVMQSESATPAAFEAAYSIGNAASKYTFGILTTAFGINDYVATTYKGMTIASKAISTPHVYATQFTASNTGAGMKLWVDGVEPTYATSGTITSRTFSDGFIIGSWFAAGAEADLDIGEMEVYNGNMTDADRKKMELYLSLKWGIAITQ